MEEARSSTAGVGAVSDAQSSSPPGSLATKLDLLFRRTKPPGQGREYSYDQVADAIAANGGPTISANYIYMLRRGIRDNPTKRHLEALAEFFSVTPGYFFDQDSDPHHEALAALAKHGERVVSLARALDSISAESATVLRDLVGQASRLRDLAGPPAPIQHPGPAAATAGQRPATMAPAQPELRASEQVRADLESARLAIRAGDPAAAIQRLESLLAGGGLSRAAEDHTLYNLAIAHEGAADLESAIRVICPLYRRSLTASSEFTPGCAGAALSYYYHQAGDLDAAIRIGEIALEASERLGLGATYDHVALAINVMWANYGLGNLAQFSAMADYFLEVSRQNGLTAGEAGIYWNAAMVDSSIGRFDRAVDNALRALGHLNELEADRNLPRMQVDVAWCLLCADPARAHEAAELLERCRPYLEGPTDVTDLGSWHTTRALAHLRVGEHARAEALGRQAVGLLGEHSGHESARAQMMLGDAVAAQGRPAEALAHYRRAVRVADGIRVPRPAAELFRELADRIDRLEPSEAATLYRKALNAARVPGSAIALETAFAGNHGVVPTRQSELAGRERAVTELTSTELTRAELTVGPATPPSDPG